MTIFTPREIAHRIAAWLICSLALTALATACEIENAPPPRVAVAPTATPEITITPAPEPASEPTPIATPASEPTATPAPASESTPAPEPTPAPHREYTLAPAGSAVVTDNGLALTITSFTPDAESVLANENPDYEPLEGYRPLIARLRVQNVGGNENNPIPMEFAIGYLRLIDSSSVTLGGMADTVRDRHCGTVPDDIERFHESAALFPGGTLEGNLCFEVPKSETDLVLMYDDGEGYDNQRFLALANPDSAEPVRVVDAPLEPQAAGRSRFNPVPPGGHVESADGLLALTVISTDMDADISAIPYSRYHDRGDPYYHPPAEGNRLIAARVRVQNVGGDVDTALTADGGQFAIVGSSAIESHAHQRGCRATLDPPALFLGGIVEINVCFEVPESETDLVMNYASGEERRESYYSPHSDDAPRRWLALGSPDTVEAARVVDASPEPAPDGQANGRLRSAAAPPGASVYDRFGMAVSIVSAMDATDEILKYNPYNDPPAEGNRFIMARARLDWVGGNASDNVNIGGYLFGMAGSSAVVFSYDDNSCGAISHALPILELSGGEAGEMDVCFEIPQTETDLILFYGSLNEDSARWLRLPEG